MVKTYGDHLGIPRHPGIGSATIAGSDPTGAPGNAIGGKHVVGEVNLLHRDGRK